MIRGVTISFGHNFTWSLGGFHQTGRDLLKRLNPRPVLSIQRYRPLLDSIGNEKQSVQ